MDTCAQVNQNGPQKRILFNIAVFTVSAAGGYFLTYMVFTALHQLPFWTSMAHEKANPAADVLRTLHSGFGN
jgi:hypothetical protein